jgi:serine/threonine-protein kinase
VTSTAPPTALGTTLPPIAVKTGLMAEIAIRTLQRKGKNIAIAVAAVVGLFVGIKVISSSSNASTQEATGIRASSKQGSIKLLVDGKLIGTLPQEVKGMSPGEHSIVFDAGERYAQQRRTVELVPGEMKELEPVTLKVTKGSAIFDVKTPGTQLALVSSDERRELTDYSHAIDVDNTKSWTLEATKRGYKPVALAVTFDERAERTFTVQLSESGGVDVLALPSANVTITEEPPMASLAADKPAKGKKKRERAEGGGGGARYVQAAPAMAAAPAAAVGGGGTCSLNINTIPSSHVTLDGRNLGNTPRLGVMVSSGTHNIVFSTENARKSTITSCRPGETKTVAIRMPE